MNLKLRITLAALTIVAALFLLTWQRRRFPEPMKKALDALRNWWLGVAKKIGQIQTAVILFIFYFTAIAAAALVARIRGADFLRLRGPVQWHPRKAKVDTIERMMRQF